MSEIIEMSEMREMSEMSKMPEYKELYPVVLEDLENIEDGKLCPKYQFGDEEPIFEDGEALAILLMDGVILSNCHHWVKDWPEDARKMSTLFVNCSDVFMWGASDADGLLQSEIENLYEHYHKDKKWGSAVWCIKQRNMMPQKPVYEAIQKDGIWDLDTMDLNPSIDDQIKAKEPEDTKIKEKPWWKLW